MSREVRKASSDARAWRRDGDGGWDGGWDGGLLVGGWGRGGGVVGFRSESKWRLRKLAAVRWFGSQRRRTRVASRRASFPSFPSLLSLPSFPPSPSIPSKKTARAVRKSWARRGLGRAMQPGARWILGSWDPSGGRMSSSWVLGGDGWRWVVRVL